MPNYNHNQKTDKSSFIPLVNSDGKIEAYQKNDFYYDLNFQKICQNIVIKPEEETSIIVKKSWLQKLIKRFQK